MIKLKRGALRAMSWLYEVVDPVMDGLDYDLERGEKHPIKHHVIGPSRPILRDFLRCYPEARSRFELRDQTLERAPAGSEAVDHALIEWLDHAAADLIESYDIPAAPCRGITCEREED